MNELFTTASEIQEFCRLRDWKFCIIGGMAVLRWGQIRVTKDVVITLLTGFGRERLFVDELLKGYQLRPPCTREFALKNRVLLLTKSRNIPLDVALGAVPFEERSIRRSTMWEAEKEFFLRTCSAEDLLVHKCFANRDLDWNDVDGILARQSGKLNMKRVWTELNPLVKLKESPQIIDRLKERIAHHGSAFTRIKPAKSRKKPR